MVKPTRQDSTQTFLIDLGQLYSTSIAWTFPTLLIFLVFVFSLALFSWKHRVSIRLVSVQTEKAIVKPWFWVTATISLVILTSALDHCLCWMIQAWPGFSLLTEASRFSAEMFWKSLCHLTYQEPQDHWHQKSLKGEKSHHHILPWVWQSVLGMQVPKKNKFSSHITPTNNSSCNPNVIWWFFRFFGFVFWSQERHILWNLSKKIFFFMEVVPYGWFRNDETPKLNFEVLFDSFNMLFTFHMKHLLNRLFVPPQMQILLFFWGK